MDDADDMDDEPVLFAPTTPDTVDDLATILFEDEGVVVDDRICNRIVYSIERNRSIGNLEFRALNFTNTFDFILPFYEYIAVIKKTIL